MSQTASRGWRKRKDVRLKVIGIKKPFLHGTTKRRVYIQLPKEDDRCQSGRYMGLFNWVTFGTQDAPAAWQRVVHEVLGKLGFVLRVTTPCEYFHKGAYLRIVAHVGVFYEQGPQNKQSGSTGD